MRFCLPIFLATVLAASLALPQTPASTKKRSTAPKAAVSKKAATSKKGKSSNKKTVAAYRQMAPTPDRYREIQQALVDKGYLKSEPNGVWDAQSSDALKQFQTNTKLSPTGKLSSASLIALGLGPSTAVTQVPGSTTPPAPN